MYPIQILNGDNVLFSAASLKKVTEKANDESKGKETANADDPVVKAQKQLKDLQDIIPDIMAKVQMILHLIIFNFPRDISSYM